MAPAAVARLTEQLRHSEQTLNTVKYRRYLAGPTDVDSFRKGSFRSLVYCLPSLRETHEIAGDRKH
jgi:hypothetical protein